MSSLMESRASAWAMILMAGTSIGVATACSRELPDVKDGDVIFQTSRSSQSAAIQLATHSPYSHMGIVFLREGQPYVLEASATVRYTSLRAWVARGVDGDYVVERLRNGATVQQVNRLRASASAFLGLSYDAGFERSDSRMY
jgi:hypothetical protein